VYIADYGNHRVRMVDTNGIITTIAGTGTPGNLGDEGPAIEAQLQFPRGLAVDENTGNLYIADSGTNTVRMIDARTHSIHRVAGKAAFNGPTGLAVDQATGSLYIADSTNNRLVKVTSDGMISTLAGSDASLSLPVAIAIDGKGDIYIADAGNNRVRRIDARGTITTVSTFGLTLNHPLGIAVNSSGYVFVADTNTDRCVC